MLTSIIFCRNRYAKRLAMFEGILHFSCGMQRNIFDYGSRVSRLPSYSTILNSLSKLADSAEEKLKAIG